MAQNCEVVVLVPKTVGSLEQREKNELKSADMKYAR